MNSILLAAGVVHLIFQGPGVNPWKDCGYKYGEGKPLAAYDAAFLTKAQEGMCSWLPSVTLDPKAAKPIPTADLVAAVRRAGERDEVLSFGILVPREKLQDHPALAAAIEAIRAERDRVCEKEVKPTDVYLLIGQSNMAGRGDLTPTNRIDMSRIVKWEGDHWTRAVEPITRDRATASGFSLAATFARTMADADPNAVIGLIPTAIGGTSLHYEWARPWGFLYQRAVQMTKLALPPNARLRGILWHQGESDCDAKYAPLYEEMLCRMLVDLRRDVGDVPVVLGELGEYLYDNKDFNRAYVDQVNQALRNVAARFPWCACASAKGLACRRDILHFDTPSVREFGLRYAQAMKELQAKKMPAVTFGGPKGESILVDGKPVQIRAGEIHPQRIPREYWLHRIRMCKAMGLNAISSYFMWSDFENPRAWHGFDFKTGRRNVGAFLDLCRREKMWVLFRPGPYICGEWDFGGLPVRLLRDPSVKIRSSDPRFMKEALRYLAEIANEAEPYLVKNGGTIVLTQIENEYGSWPFEKDKAYLTAIKDFWKSRGFGPFYMADGAGDGYLKDLIYPDKEIAVGLDPGGNAKEFDVARKWNPGVPILSAETYPGWLRHWGESNWAPSDLSEAMRWYMKDGCSFSIFVAHGGTTFGFSTGANDGGEGGYLPDLTSYDFAAPIDEQGNATPAYHAYRKLIGEALGEKLIDVPAPIPTTEIAAFTPKFHANLRDNCGKAHTSARPCSFEQFGQNQGIMIYSAKVPAGPAAELVFVRVSDYAQISLDGKRLATIDRRKKLPKIELPAREREATLEILVEAMGHIDFGGGMPYDRKGILEKVLLGTSEIRGWTMTEKPLTEQSVAEAKASAKRDACAGGHYRGTFTVAKPADTFLDMSKWTKGTLYVNGINLGRYWNIGPQYSLYCPASFLKEGENTIDVVELELTEPQPIRGVRKNVVRDSAQKTKNANNVW